MQENWRVDGAISVVVRTTSVSDQKVNRICGLQLLRTGRKRNVYSAQKSRATRTRYFVQQARVKLTGLASRTKSYISILSGAATGGTLEARVTTRSRRPLPRFSGVLARHLMIRRVL